MAEDAAVKLAETQSKLERLQKQVKDAASERAKAFMAANVKKIPLLLVKAGLESKLAALFASDADEERIVKFAGADGKETSQSVSALVIEILSGLPEQVTLAETRESTAHGADADESAAGLPERLAGNWDKEGDEYFLAATAEMEAEKAKGNTINFAEAAKRVYAKKGGRD